MAVSETARVEAPFEVRFVAVDLDSGDPIVGATCKLVESAEAESESEPRVLTFESDSNGRASCVGVTEGTWTLEVRFEGYDDTSVTLDLPGAWSGVLAAEGAVDLREVRLIPSVEVQFRLEGAEVWGGAERFSVETLEKPDEVPVAAGGLVTLSYGSIPDPILVRVNYPDGTEGWDRFATEGVAPQEPLVLRVAGERTLEVRVHLSEKAEIAVGDTPLHVRAIHVGERSFSRSAAREIDDSGVYVFRGIESEFVNVGVVSAGVGQQVEWAMEEVVMEPSGTTAVELLVEAPPIELRFQDEIGTPLAGVGWRLRPTVERCGWLAGGVSTEAGTALVPRCAQSPAMNLFAHLRKRRIFVLDLPIDLSTQNDQVVVPMGPGKSTEIQVLDSLGDVPVGEVHVFSMYSRQWAISTPIGSDGWTEPFELVEPSKGMFEVACEGYWVPEPSLELVAGRQSVIVYRLGELVAETRERLRAIESVEFEVSLGAWIDGGRVELAEADGSAMAAVPIGPYRRLGGSGEWETFEVVAPGR